MAEREKIRPIYSELQGYLSHAPSEDGIARAMWEQVNVAIEQLSEISGEDYNRFKMVPRQLESGRDRSRAYLDHSIYRTNLGGLIARLHAEYFSDEDAPFKGMPSTVITQTQQQSQSFQVELVFEMVSKIEKQLQQLDPKDKRYGFLEKVKGALKSVRNATELIALYVTTAKEFGITLEELSQLFR